jgi:hypothetical protein
MYRQDDPNQMEFQNFHLPFGGQLDGENRWVILAKQIPWQRIEQEYSAIFSQDEGCPAKAARVGFGALIIKERLGVAEELGCQCYFAKPYHSWERGLNENTNGLIRQYFPKKMSFAKITADQIAMVQNRLNTRPRKCLGFKPPDMVYFSLAA